MNELRCTAVLTCRNERQILERLLPHWLAEGLELCVIDHSSNDGSRELMEANLGSGVLQIRDLPWLGSFSLDQQLQAKSLAIESVDSPWVMHLDADEWPQSNRPGESLLQALDRLGEAGANVVNFDEFVVLPIAESPQAEGYYYFAPSPQRLMRAWRRDSGFSNRASGGHRLEARPGGQQIQVANENLVLRHYIVSSEQHAVDKYLGRRFAEEELARGRHKNRVGLTHRELVLPRAELLQPLPPAHGLGVELDRSEPKNLHYWHWPDSTKSKPCRSLVCVYGCQADEALLEPFYNSPVGSMLKRRNDTLVLEAWAGGNGNNLLHQRRLSLALPESYGDLSLKTWQMLLYCCSHLEFEQLIKIDLSCVRKDWSGAAYAGRQPLDLDALTAYLEQRLNEPLPVRMLPQPHYDGFISRSHPSRENILQWAQKKGAQVNLDEIFEPGEKAPPFYSGKCYAISSAFAGYVAQQGKTMAIAHQRHLHGSEDLMIGRLAKQFMG